MYSPISERVVMYMRQTTIERQEQSPVHEPLQAQVQIRGGSGIQDKWWRRTWLGYVVSISLIGLALLGTLLEQQLWPHLSFSSAPLLLAVVIIALLWGVGPAIFAVLVSSLILDYFYLVPLGSFSIYTWEGLLQLLPFLLSGLLLAWLTAQREAALRRTSLLEKKLAAYADGLERANQQKDQILSIVSHELNTPITIILSQAQMLLRRLTKQPELPVDAVRVHTTLEKIEEQTQRLTLLVRDLLDLSRMREGKFTLQVGECNLGSICREVIEGQHLITHRTIELHAAPTDVILQADRERLRQVVNNLVSNAVKYSPEESLVQVHITRSEQNAVLQVHDAGPGISQEQQAHIFDAFYRTPQAQGSSKGGLGLGLAICKAIIEQHGGRIWCKSQPAEGSIFVVELPLQRKQ
jgi:signal transduction histidine kinase